MKNAKYVSNPFVYMILIISPIIVSIITLCCQEYYGALACLCIAVLFSVPLILLRKRFFIKMIIDQQGIRTYYKNKLIKDLKWENIKDAQAIPTSSGGQIIFSDNPLYSGKDKWKNSKEIFVSMNSNFAIYLFEYSKNIPIAIKDIEKLNPKIAEKFKK